MPISVTNIGTNSSTTGATAAISVGAGGVPAGALICTSAGDKSNAASTSGSWADTATNTYQRAGGASLNNTQSNGFGRVDWAENVSALVSGNTITFTKAISGSRAVISAFYATGLASSSALDVSITATQTGSSVTPTCTINTPSQDGELYVLAVVSGGNFNFGTTGNGWTTPFTGIISGGSASADVCINGSNIVASTSAPGNPITAGSKSIPWMTIVIAFKKASQILTPDLYTDGDTFFSQTVGGVYGLAPSLATDGDTFYSPVIGIGLQALSPPLFNDGETFYTAVVGAQSYLTVDALLTDADDFFAPSISAIATLLPSLLTNSPSFNTQTVSAVYALTAAALASDPGTIFTPVLSRLNTLAPALLTDADNFFTQAVSGLYTLAPSRHDSGDNVFYAADVHLTRVLAPALLTDADSFFNALISRGGSVIVPDDVFTGANSFPVPVVSPKYTIAPARFNGDDFAFFGPTATYLKNLSAPLFNDADAFFTQVLTKRYFVLPDPYTGNTNNFFTPSLNTLAKVLPAKYTSADFGTFGGLVENFNIVRPPLLTDADNFFTHTIGNGYFISPDALTVNSPPQFYAPVVSATYALLPPLHVSPDIFPTPTVIPGGVFAFPTRVNNTSSVLLPTVAIVNLIRPPFHTNLNLYYDVRPRTLYVVNVIYC